MCLVDRLESTINIQQRVLVDQESVIGALCEDVAVMYQQIQRLMEWKWEMEGSEGKMLVHGSRYQPIEVLSDDEESSHGDSGKVENGGASS